MNYLTSKAKAKQFRLNKKYMKNSNTGCVFGNITFRCIIVYPIQTIR